ncbi:MAG TPA: long-chain fatty acid--CoA ligase [Chondromyces sp.]|nr:long-chain fatty acid--CoA ligase [Chondromyces sp.]
MNIDLMIQHVAKENPSRLAVGWETGAYTYKEFNYLIEKLSNAFLSAGIKPGDRVGIILFNCPEFLLAYYACMRMGAISVPINPVLTGRELGVILNDCTPVMIITNESVNKKIETIQLSVEPIMLNTNRPDSFRYFLNSGDDKPIMIKRVTDDSTIIYTSGTTGIPKGAVLTYRNLYSNAKEFAEGMGMTGQEKTLIVAPVFHSAALTCCLNATFYSGGYNYLLERWTSSSHTLLTMEKEEISFFFGPPTMYTYILADPKLENYRMKLRMAFTGAAALPEEIFNQWKDKFGMEIVEGYGLSETSPVVTYNPPDGIKKPGSIGLPIKDVALKIIDDEGNDVQVGQAGELCVKGPNVMRGYWNRPEENKRSFIDGWFRTGDIAKMDRDGYYYIVDRKKDMIIRSGFKIYPREIEEVLYQHPNVLEAAVIGTPDRERGEVVQAVLTIKDDQNKPAASELKDFCRKKLASYKVPSSFIIVDELPKTGSGKIVKTKLREQFSEQGEMKI